ncbi:MAG: segregation and condensation protein A [Acidobacteriota bacterium]
MSAADPVLGPAVGDPFRVRLTGFEGPLDLLLHLVRKSDIDITGIPILEIVRQYDAYVALARSLSLEAAGEYLVLAATLVHLKSRRLLPTDPAEPDPLADEAAPDAALRAGVGEGLGRAAEHLQEREALMELVYARPADRVAEYAGEEGLEVDLYALLKAFQEILKRSQAGSGEPIRRERFSLVERIDWLIERLRRERRISFRDLFRGGRMDRLLCILTFLALLEVMRLQVARAYRSHRESEILVVLSGEAGQGPEPAPEVRTRV